MRAFALLLAFSLSLWPEAAMARPARVVSLNLCTDELLLALANDDQIASVTYLAKQRSETPYWRRAQSYRKNDGSLLSIAALKPDLVLIGEVGDRVVGFALALPDINQALKPAGGNLFPFGLFKILYYQRLVRNLRVVALGVVEEYRTAGVAAGFYAALIENARRLGYKDCEMSWILEDNVLMNRSLEALGAKRYKTYRIYEWN